MTETALKTRTVDELLAADDPAVPEQARFRTFAESTAEDWAAIARKSPNTPNSVLANCLEQLERAKSDNPGFPVDRYEHSLQTATRAWHDGQAEDDEMIVAALLHDIGDHLAPGNHGEFAAAILKPWVRPEIYWLVKHHEMFQGYHFFHHFGHDRLVREQYREHPHYEITRRFCDDWDQTAFDPDFETMPLEAFMPSLERVFAKPRRYVIDKVDED